MRIGCLSETQIFVTYIFQAKILYNVPFSEDERQNIKLKIQCNLYGYLTILLEGRKRFEEEVLLENRKLQFADGPGSSGTTIEAFSGKTCLLSPAILGSVVISLKGSNMICKKP